MAIHPASPLYWNIEPGGAGSAHYASATIVPFPARLPAAVISASRANAPYASVFGTGNERG